MKTRPRFEETDGKLVVNPSIPKMNIEDRLEVLGELAKGGMGKIETAYDKNLNRVVVKKTILPESAENPLIRTRFIEEAQVMGQLGHPNIVPIYELGIDEEGKLFFTMKKIDGITLEEFVLKKPIEKRNWNDLHEQLNFFIQICDAVAFMHSRGVIHRDIKPQNIMVGNYGEVYLMDYGLVKCLPHSEKLSLPPCNSYEHNIHNSLVESEEGKIYGTLSFAAPEQVVGQGDMINEKTDIFQLGALLYFILTHRAPYEETNNENNVVKVLECKITSPGEIYSELPPVIASLAMRAMSKKQQDRFESVSEFRDAVLKTSLGPWPCKLISFAAGTKITEEGEKGDKAYIIRLGMCRVYKTINGKRQSDMRTMKPKDTFGEAAVLRNKVRSATVEALTDVRVLEIDKSAFDDALHNNWMAPFVHSMNNRFIEKDEKLALAEAKLVEDKIVIGLLTRILSQIKTSSKTKVARGKALAAVAEELGIDVKQVEEVLLSRKDIFDADTVSDTLTEI